MKLITELYDENIKTELINESENEKSLYIKGIFMQSEVKNRNGRIYPSHILENAVNTYIENYVNKNRAIGELNHPNGPSVNPERASHKIVELVKEGNNFYGKAKILRTPVGQIVRSLIEDGVSMGVSSRGMGSLKEGKNGIMEVQDDFFLATVDIVADPSAPDAFVNGIMEGVEYIFDNGRLIEMKAEELKKQIDEDARAKRLSEQRKIQIFENFIRQISKV